MQWYGVVVFKWFHSPMMLTGDHDQAYVSTNRQWLEKVAEEHRKDTGHDTRVIPVNVTYSPGRI